MKTMKAFQFAKARSDDPVALVQQLCGELVRSEVEGEQSFGLLYLGEALAGSSREILDGLQEATGVSWWAGCSGMALLAGREEFYDASTGVVLVGTVPEGSVRVVPGPVESFEQLVATLNGFLQPQDSGRLILHASPDFHALDALLQEITRETEWYVTGGVISGSAVAKHFADGVTEGGVSGLAFRETVPLAVRHTQGCSPLPGKYRLTETWRNIMVRLDDQPALTVFRSAIGEVLSRDLRRALGYIQVGLPIATSDTGDYRVRNIIGIDLDRDLLAVGEMLDQGESILFVRRDAQAAKEDLLRMLEAINRQCPNGIRGGLYFDCLGRGREQFGEAGVELGIIQDALGDVPLVGFFANGEIFSNHIYGYTGVLLVFPA